MKYPWVMSCVLFLVAIDTRSASAGPSWPELGLQAHYTRWEGDYSSQGVGGRFRWEPLSWFGVEGLLEALFSEDGPSTIEIPIGAQVYFPWEFVPRARARAIAGTCGMVTLSRGASPHASDSDDVSIGVKLGGGLEVALGGGWTLFSDVAWQHYLGHSRQVSVWSDALDGDLTGSDRLTIAVGLGMGL
jgi:hypothetical protein